MSREFQRQPGDVPAKILLARRRASERQHPGISDGIQVCESDEEYLGNAEEDHVRTGLREQLLYEELERYPEQSGNHSLPHRYRWKTPFKTALAVFVLGILCIAVIYGVGTHHSSAPESIPLTGQTAQPVTKEQATELPAVSAAQTSSASGTEFQVHVAGAVKNPGLYSISATARIGAAIEHAGGAIGEADLNRVNLAQPVTDGLQILVPQQGEQVSVPSQMTSIRPSEGSSESEVAQTLINLNTASAEQLQELPRVGPKLAQKIIDYRESNGPYAAVEDLDNVAGIGPTMLENISPLVTV